MERLKVVHIEDSEMERTYMEIAFRQANNLQMVGSTPDADEGLLMVKEYIPDVVILDLELRDSSKDGTYFLKELKNLNIPFRPFILITTWNVDEFLLAPIRQLGACFVYSKAQRDYGTDLVIQFLTNMQEALFETKHIRKTIYHEDNKVRFNEQIDVEFKKIWMKRSKGYTYLKEAIQLLYENNTDYKEIIAKKYKTTVKKIEDAMQYIIKNTWNNAPVMDWLENYTGITLSHKGIPTVKEFIYYYCDKIKEML